MAWRLALYPKKRGDRVTGSAKLATISEALLFAACLLVGAIALTVILRTVVIPQHRAYREFTETQCQIADVPGIEAEASPKGTVYRPRIPFEYEVAGQRYISDRYDMLTRYADRSRAEKIAASYKVGESHPCWYDPKAPTTAVLTRGNKLTFWLLLLLPSAFLAIGVGGLGYTWWQWSTSQERRAAIVKIASDIESELRDEPATAQPKYPAVPRDTDLTNSPGTTLTYRLPIATQSGWRLFGIAGACLIWNMLVGLVIFTAVRKHLAGKPDWLLNLMTLPFFAAGLWLVYRLVKQWLGTSGVGTTRIEISQHPLQPGCEYELYLSQGGRLSVNRLELALVCEEHASYRQGTDTVTSTQEVGVHPILTKENFDIDPLQPFESRCRFEIPHRAMHSFRSAHNAICWKLVVRGDVAKWPAYERSFPVVVIPEENGQAAEETAGQPADHAD